MLSFANLTTRCLDLDFRDSELEATLVDSFSATPKNTSEMAFLSRIEQRYFSPVFSRLACG